MTTPNNPPKARCGGFHTFVSPHDADRGVTRCPQCGKWCKFRIKSGPERCEVFIRPHNRQEH